jgi:hypothetical protein
LNRLIYREWLLNKQRPFQDQRQASQDADHSEMTAYQNYAPLSLYIIAAVFGDGYVFILASKDDLIIH